MKIFSQEGVVDSEGQMRLSPNDLDKLEGIITACFPTEPSVFMKDKGDKGYVYYLPSEEQFQQFRGELGLNNEDDLVGRHLRLYIDRFGDRTYAIHPIPVA